jgi:Tfp pilus assembly PilM family ATPase
MPFGSSGIIALDLTSKRLRLLHAVVSGASLSVYHFAAENLFAARPENVADQLGTLLRRAGIRSAAAAVALSGPEVVHRVLEFPSMPVKELGPVVAREMRLLGDSGEKEVAFDWEVIEESQGGSLDRLRIVVAVAPRSQTEATLETLRACRLKPALFTTIPLSLLRSLKFIGGEALGFQVVLYLGAEQGYLLGLRHGAWGFLREFSSRAEDMAGEGILEEATREASRAFVYFGQGQREEQKVVFLLGGDRRLDALKLRVQQELGAQAEVVRPGHSVDLTPLKERAGVFRDAFPSFLVTLGLVAASAHPGINLAPTAARRALRFRPQWDLAFFQRPAWLVLAFLVVVGVQWLLNASVAKQSKLLEDRVVLYAEWMPVARLAEESRSLHENEKILAGVLGEVSVADASWVSRFKWLSHVVSPGLLLQSVSLKNDQGKWQARFQGEVVAVDLYSAQAAFNRFYRALKDSPRIEAIDLLPLRVSTVAEPGPVRVAATAAEGSDARTGEAESQEIKRTKVEFELRATWSGR